MAKKKARKNQPLMPVKKRAPRAGVVSPKLEAARKARRVILERTARARRELDKKCEGVDISDLAHLPVVVGAYKPGRSFHARTNYADEVDDRKPVAAPPIAPMAPPREFDKHSHVPSQLDIELATPLPVPLVVRWYDATRRQAARGREEACR